MSFLSDLKEQYLGQYCETCGNLEQIKPGLIGCIARDKLILPEYPPYYKGDPVGCPDWKERVECFSE